MKPSVHHQRIIALLAQSLFHKPIEACLFVTPKGSAIKSRKWKAALKRAKQLGVYYLSLDGVQYLPGTIHPPVKIKDEWIRHAWSAQERHMTQEIALDALAELFEPHELRLVLLKGYGLSRLYPVPAYRERVDIDIFVQRPSEILTQTSHMEGEEWIQQNEIPVQCRNYQFTSFIYHGIKVKLHKQLLDLRPVSPMLAKLYDLAQDNIIRAYVSVPEKEREGCGFMLGNHFIQTLTPKANGEYILAHCFAHYLRLAGRIGHLCDWGLFLQQNEEQLKRDNFFANISSPSLQKYAREATAVLEHYFGLKQTVIPTVEVSHAHRDRMLRQYLHPKPQFSERAKSCSNLRLRIKFIRKECHIYQHYIGNHFWAEQGYKRLGDFLKNLILRKNKNIRYSC